MTLAKQQIHTHSIEAKMTNIIENIMRKKYILAREQLEEEIRYIMERKLLEKKHVLASTMFQEMKLENMPPDYENVEDDRRKQTPNEPA